MPVYLARVLTDGVPDGPIKIGWSRDPGLRVAALAKHVPGLQLLRTYPFGIATERLLHDHFRVAHWPGMPAEAAANEWYYPVASLLALATEGAVLPVREKPESEPDPSIPDAVELLAQAIGSKRGCRRDAAKRIGCHASQLTRILLRKRWPELGLALRIERAYPEVSAHYWAHRCPTPAPGLVQHGTA